MKIIIAVLFLFCSAFLSAQNTELLSDSGNAFLRNCSSVELSISKLTDEEKQNGITCFAYIKGFDQAFELQHSITQKELKEKGNKYQISQQFCIPEPVELAQEVMVVLKYIRNHPAIAHLPTPLLILNAFRESSPCTTQ